MKYSSLGINPGFGAPHAWPGKYLFGEEELFHKIVFKPGSGWAEVQAKLSSPPPPVHSIMFQPHICYTTLQSIDAKQVLHSSQKLQWLAKQLVGGVGDKYEAWPSGALYVAKFLDALASLRPKLESK